MHNTSTVIPTLIFLNVLKFAGWWLSMKPEDSFFSKLNDIDRMPEIYESRFKPENDDDLLKTLGFVLVSYVAFLYYYLHLLCFSN